MAVSMKQNFIIIILSKERTQWSELPALLLKIIFINSFILNSDQLGKRFCFLLPAHIMDIKDFLSRLKCIRKVSLTSSALSRQCTPAEAPWEGDGIFFLAIWALQRPSNYSLGADRLQGPQRARVSSEQENGIPECEEEKLGAIKWWF